MKKLLLMDIDDTICNASEAYAKALNKCWKLVRDKFPILTKDVFISYYKKAREQIHVELEGTAAMHNRFLYFQRLFELLGVTLEPTLLDEITETYWEETYKNLRLFPNVSKTLKTLKEHNIKIGIVTDLIAHVQIKKLKKLEVAEHIDFIVTSEEAGKEKPHPAIFLLALRKANVLPKDALMVGDSLKKDVQGALQLGIDALWMNGKKGQGYEVIEDFGSVLERMGIVGDDGLFSLVKQHMAAKKVVVFDLIGTLTSQDSITPLMAKILKRHGKKVGMDRLKEAYVVHSLGAVRRLNSLFPEEYQQELLQSIRARKGAKELLAMCKKKGYKVAILSNLHSSWGNKLLESLGFSKYVDIALFSNDVGSRKPSEETYVKLAGALEAPPENIYFIDDRLENLREARFFSMKTIWFRTSKKEQITFIPDYVANGIRELRKLLAAL